MAGRAHGLMVAAAVCWFRCRAAADGVGAEIGGAYWAGAGVGR